MRTRQALSPMDRLLRAESEKAFLGRIRRTAALFDWKTYHTHISQRSEPGFPDLVLVRAPDILLWEIKTMSGQPDAEQYQWLEQLQRCEHVTAELLRPNDWDSVLEVLR